MELARRAVKAFNRRDLDVLVEVTTADVEWFPAMPGSVKDGYRGRAGVETYLAEVHDTWKDYRARSSVFSEAAGAVLALGRAQGRGRDTGVTVDSPLGMVFDFRDGKISRVRSYLDHDQAAHAARSSRVRSYLEHGPASHAARSSG
jgi:ketosteroid isomerase-like protein